MQNYKKKLQHLALDEVVEHDRIVEPQSKKKKSSSNTAGSQARARG
jgi:hypothetical protein